LQLTLKAKTITIDEVTLPVIASTICKNASTLHVQQLNDSLAKEPISTQDANKHATQMLDTKDKKSRSPVNRQRQLQASKCQSSKMLLQLLMKDELPFDGTLGDWKTKPVSFQQRKRILHHSKAFPELKTHKIPSSS
jgi:hypothetical protein